MKKTSVIFDSAKKLLICLLLFLGAACSSTPESKNTLRISISGNPTTLSPTECHDFTSSTLVCLLHEGLTRCLPGSAVEPAVAEKIDVSSDRTVYTFHLRKTVWRDGTVVTAHDFERSWKRALDPKHPSVCAYLFYPIVGAEAAVRGEKSLNEVGIWALDERTLRVHLEKPTEHFLSLTAFPSFLPVSETGSVNGPFFMEKTTPNQEIVLKKNELFWSKRQIHLSGIHVSIVADENTAWKLFEQGKLDWLGGAISPVPWEAFESLREKAVFDSMAASTFCVFNVNDKLFSNEHIRQAFVLSMNREQIAEQILHGTQIVPHGCVPPSLWGEQVPTTLPSFNPEEAKRLFLLGCQELHLDLQHIGPIHLSIRTNTVDRLLAQILQWQWHEGLGVEVVIDVSDTKTLKQHLHERKYEVAITNWIAQYHHPLNILERFKSKNNPKNYAGWESAEFNRLVEAGKWTEAEMVLAKSGAIAPIYHWQIPSVCSQRVKDMHTTSSGGVLFERAKLVEFN